jgi:hypothetical protein
LSLALLLKHGEVIGLMHQVNRVGESRIQDHDRYRAGLLGMSFFVLYILLNLAL